MYLSLEREQRKIGPPQTFFNGLPAGKYKRC
jgi:hypothetical protein